MAKQIAPRKVQIGHVVFEFLNPQSVKNFLDSIADGRIKVEEIVEKDFFKDAADGKLKKKNKEKAQKLAE